MADQTTISVILRARDEASGQLKKVEGNMNRLADSFAKHRRGIGMAATAIGAAITGIAVLSVKSSLDQEIGIRTLNEALKRVGTSYESNKEKIEAVISAQQNKTNFGDEEQRKALEKLITIGGTYDGSLRALEVTMDLAAGLIWVWLVLLCWLVKRLQGKRPAFPDMESSLKKARHKQKLWMR